MKMIATLAVLTLASTASADDQLIAEPRCWLGSLTFSPGATVRASDQVMECDIKGHWTSTQRKSFGCVRDGNVYSAGAVEPVTSSKTKIACADDGTWKPSD